MFDKIMDNPYMRWFILCIIMPINGALIVRDSFILGIFLIGLQIPAYFVSVYNPIKEYKNQKSSNVVSLLQHENINIFLTIIITPLIGWLCQNDYINPIIMVLCLSIITAWHMILIMPLLNKWYNHKHVHLSIN